MSLKDYRLALEIIDQHSDQILFSLPQDETQVAAMEALLDTRLPFSYREFQKKYGALGFCSLDILGLTKDEHLKDSQVHSGNVVYVTLDNRNANPPLPKAFVAIHRLGNGELSCLDTSKMNADGECPVVAWYFGATEVLAEDFGAFLLDQVKQAIANDTGH